MTEDRDPVAPGDPPAIDLQGLDHLAVTVRDVAASIAWYRDVLGLEHRFAGAWGGVPAMMARGDTMIALFPAGEAEEGAARDRPGVDYQHFAFRTDGSGFERAQAALHARGIRYEFQDHELARSIYFRDPDGYLLEITTYDP